MDLWVNTSGELPYAEVIGAIVADRIVFPIYTTPNPAASLARPPHFSLDQDERTAHW